MSSIHHHLLLRDGGKFLNFKFPNKKKSLRGSAQRVGVLLPAWIFTRVHKYFSFFFRHMKYFFFRYTTSHTNEMLHTLRRRLKRQRAESAILCMNRQTQSHANMRDTHPNTLVKAFLCLHQSQRMLKLSIGSKARDRSECNLFDDKFPLNFPHCPNRSCASYIIRAYRNTAGEAELDAATEETELWRILAALSHSRSLLCVLFEIPMEILWKFRYFSDIFRKYLFFSVHRERARRVGKNLNSSSSSALIICLFTINVQTHHMCVAYKQKL